MRHLPVVCQGHAHCKQGRLRGATYDQHQHRSQTCADEGPNVRGQQANCALFSGGCMMPTQRMTAPVIHRLQWGKLACRMLTSTLGMPLSSRCVPPVPPGWMVSRISRRGRVRLQPQLAIKRALRALTQQSLGRNAGRRDALQAAHGTRSDTCRRVCAAQCCARSIR